MNVRFAAAGCVPAGDGGTNFACWIWRCRPGMVPSNENGGAAAPGGGLMKSTKIIVLILAGSFLIACGANMLPSRDPWYAMHYFIMQDYERGAYRALSDNGRLEFQKLFWEARSPEAKKLFDARMEYIENNFKKENFKQPWNTDRARVYLLNGNPASIEYTQNNNWALSIREGGSASNNATSRSGEDIQATTLEVWSYPYDRFIVAYAFSFDPPNKWQAVTMAASGSRYIGELELNNKSAVWGAKNPDAYARRLEEFKTIK
jgi:GWxTD domain-containing protein